MQERRLIICLTVAILIPFVVFGLLPTPSWAISVSAFSVSAATCTQITLNYTRSPTINDDGVNDYFRLVISDNTGAQLFATTGFAKVSDGTQSRVGRFTYSRPSTGSTVFLSMYDQTSISATAPNGPLAATTSAAIPCAPPTAIPSPTPIPSATPIPPATGTPMNPTATSIGPTATLVPTIPGVPSATPTISVAPPVLGPSYYPPERRVMASIRRDTPVYGLPDASGPVVAHLQAGQTWFVTGVDDTGLFNEVFLGGPDLGWIKAADVEMHGPLPVIPSSIISTAQGTGGDINRFVSGNPIGAAVIHAYTLRIRSGPGLDNPQIGLAYQGDTYTVFAKRGLWFNVSGPGGAGWVHGDWIVLNGSLAGQQAAPGIAKGSSPQTVTSPLPGVVMAYTLRLRSGPRLSSLQVGMATQNEVYTVVGQSPNGIWLNVSGPGGSGWVDGSYVKVLGARAQLPILR